MESGVVFKLLRWIPVLVSRNPVEVIFFAALLASGCWHYLTAHFGPSWPLSPQPAVTAYSGRFAWDGRRWASEIDDDSVPGLPYLHLESLWVQPTPSAIVDVKGALTRRSFRALFGLKDKVEHDVFMRTEQANFTLMEHLRPLYVLSPTQYWNDSVDDFLADSDVLGRIAAGGNAIKVPASSDGVDARALSVAQTALFSCLHHGDAVDGVAKVNRASALVLSYVFNITAPEQIELLAAWREKVGLIEMDLLAAETLIRERSRHRRHQSAKPFRFTNFASGLWTIKDIIEV
jgi:hypothetical protein